jgi:class 3 adenylate cyclase
MEPQVRYATTKDDVSIAYAVAGDGPTLLRVGTPGYTHVQRDWGIFTDLTQRLARTFRLVWYDQRGTGMSDRDAVDFSMQSMTADVQAVIESTGPDSFSILALSDAVPIAVTYAAEFPDRVSHVILVDGWTSKSDYISDNPAFDAHVALIDGDWTVYTETLARVLLGIDDQRLVESLGEHMRACVEQDAYRAFGAAVEGYDVSDLLPGVKAPTLVLHNRHNNFYPAKIGQKIAAKIPDARFLEINDLNYEGIAPLIEEFAGTRSEPQAAPSSAFRTVIFTDIVGHTEMMSRLGDAKGRDVLREHERITREVLAAHGGTEVKTMGDGFMASFGSVTKAVECAIALQQAFAERESDEPLSIRVGINAGEPIEEDGDLFGATVILASRIAAKADGGEILVADTVRGLCSGKGFLFADQGEFVAKGFEEPVRVYEVRWRE